MATITINKENFYHNLNQIALKTGSVDKIAVVLKDNAYGHGLELVAGLAEEFGIKHAVVKDLKEAKRIKTFFDTILILNGEPIADETFHFAINTLDMLQHVKPEAQIELKVDTGMHRNGIAMQELDEALRLIKENGLNLVGVMTHFRAADVLSSEFFWQQKNFESVKTRVIKAGYGKVRFHSQNSAATLRAKHFDDDMVRAGIAIYGYNELLETFDAPVLKPIIKLYAKKAATRFLQKSQRVGYAGDFEAPRDMTVSTYDLGYGDGWTRADSQDPYITSEGLPILGRVSMDFISLESEKAQVLIMDNAQKAAKHFGTISYEVTTGLSSEIERTIV